MEMAQIRYALAASQTLNFTKAAKACNISQPALTKSIKALESELGAPLFHRDGRAVRLSDFGHSMMPTLQKIQDDAAAAVDLAESYKLLNQVPVRVGVIPTLGHRQLSRFIADFEAGNPGVELALSEAVGAELAHHLEDGTLDAIFLNPGTHDSSRFNCQPLYSERYMVILPPDHPLKASNAIPLAALSGENYVDRLSCEMREMVMQVCETREVSLYARFRSEREDWVQAMVAAGIGFAFMPEYAVTQAGVVQRPLIEPDVSRDVALATMPGRRFSPALAAFVRAARAHAWPG